MNGTLKFVFVFVYEIDALFVEDVLLQVNFRTGTGTSCLSVKDVGVRMTLSLFKRCKKNLRFFWFFTLVGTCGA